MKPFALLLAFAAAAQARPIRISEACSDATGTMTIRGTSESTEAALTRTYRWKGETIQLTRARLVPNSLHHIEIQETPGSTTTYRHVHFAQRIDLDGRVREGGTLRTLAEKDLWIICSRTHFR